MSAEQESPSNQGTRQPTRISQRASPRTGATSAPYNTIPGSPSLSSGLQVSARQTSTSLCSSSLTSSNATRKSRLSSPITSHRRRTMSGEIAASAKMAPASPAAPVSRKSSDLDGMITPRSRRKKSLADASEALAKQKAKSAQKVNDSMVYLDGPQVYTCAQCRTHLTSHDDIISKSFHGRHGRAYLFDQCVNVTRGQSEERRLMTGLHTVCDIFCKRCKGMVGWTYLRAYETSQKYKEGKFIIEKINLHLEESDYYEVSHPAGERADRWRKRSMSWGSESGIGMSPRSDIIYEYDPSSCAAQGVSTSPRIPGTSNGFSGPPPGGNPQPPPPPFL